MICTLIRISRFTEVYLNQLIKIGDKEGILFSIDIIKVNYLCKIQIKISKNSNLSYNLNNCKYAT
jgi:hypothetical protein